ncbi:MAG: hypothetical protein MR867_06050 [Eubacterium sp.]|nr:hypothetical protein [Eubacterium sp.]MDY5496715.1 hypothetical protein [Anaerobutyricum sp.]
MTARPVEPASGSTPVRTFTSCRVMNDMLNDCVRQAEDEKIRLMIDSTGFYKGQYETWFCKLLKMTIARAFHICKTAAPPRNRYIKIRSMEEQNRIFVKIICSCEGNLKEKDFRYSSLMREILDREEGYFKMQDEEMEQIVMISVPLSG